MLEANTINNHPRLKKTFAGLRSPEKPGARFRNAVKPFPLRDLPAILPSYDEQCLHLSITF